MKVYVVYNSTLHLSDRQDMNSPEKYKSLCGATDAYDIRDYAKNGGADIYAYSDVTDTKIASSRFNTSICESCFNQDFHDNLNEIPPEFRDMLQWHDDVNMRDVGSPSSVATDGGEIIDYIERNTE